MYLRGKKFLTTKAHEVRSQRSTKENDEIFFGFQYYLCKQSRIKHQTLIRQTMKTLKQLFFILVFLIPMLAQAVEKEIPLTLDDRDRIIRTEQKVESLNAEMNARFDQLFNFLWAIIGIFTTMMVSVFGFAFWDRKLSMRPMKDEQRKIMLVLREYADHQPRLREILKNAGLL